MQTINFGVVGIHGYARSHIAALQAGERAGVRLVAAVAHNRRQDESYAAGLEAAGVRLLPDFESLLALGDGLAVITLPVDIALHVPMAERALAAGRTVYLEKPVTGAIQDFDRLAAVRVPQPLFVGFQHLFQPALWALKRRVLSGALGVLRRAVVLAVSLRDSAYYGRNAWAGRLAVGGTWVLDSPLNNAFAHYLNVALFLAGSREASALEPAEVTAELYRVNSIESADTVAVRVRSAAGVEIVFLGSHAGAVARGPLLRLEGSAGEAVCNLGGVPDGDWHLRPLAGPEERVANGPWADPFQAVARILRGARDVPACDLALARPHCLVVNGAHRSSPVRELDAGCREELPRPPVGGRPVTARVIRGLDDGLGVCFERGCLPSESGRAAWARPGRPLDVSGLRVFCLPAGRLG